MKQCPHCTAPIDDDAEFCVYCGSKIEKTPCCPNCGNAIEPGTKFCTNCGAKLEEPADAPKDEIEEIADAPKDVVEEIEQTEQVAETPSEEENVSFNDEQETLPVTPEVPKYNESWEESKSDGNGLLLKIVSALLAIVVIGVCYYFYVDSQNRARVLAMEKARQDSLALVAKQLRQDSITAAAQAELAKKEWEEFTSTDLKTFFVKGHVKEIVYGTDYTTTIRFSEDGKLTYHSHYQNGEFQYQYERNSKGQLTYMILEDSWDGGDEGETYKYNADGYPCYYCNWCSDTIEEEYTRYDENHWPTRGKGHEGDAPITYTYPAVDGHGNWTTRKTIVHYSNIFEGDEDQTYTEKRTIKYYNFRLRGY